MAELCKDGIQKEISPGTSVQRFMAQRETKNKTFKFYIDYFSLAAAVCNKTTLMGKKKKNHFFLRELRVIKYLPSLRGIHS